jgi:YHS domain-containing protein
MLQEILMPLSRRTVLMIAAAVPVVAFISTRGTAATTAIYAEDGIAIDGTDAVAYFSEGKPVSGTDEFTFDWQGATWRFASDENRATFAADPTAYAPQYGGYCAYAAADGKKVSTVPDAWAIRDGKLYLNYSGRIQSRWEEDPAGYITAADAHWRDIGVN